MNLCVLAQPLKGMIYADIGDYGGDCDPEAMIHNEDFVDWEGTVARHFVRCDYYYQYMDGGENLFKEAFKDYSHFAWFEHQKNHTRHSEEAEFWVDEDNALYGEWLLLLFDEEEQQYHWFNSEEDAQVFFVWLSSPNIQELLYDANKLEGSKFPRSYATQII